MKEKMLREDAIDLAVSMINKAPRWERPEFETGYFEGLTAGWAQAGLISDQEMTYLRVRLREMQSRHDHRKQRG